MRKKFHEKSEKRQAPRHKCAVPVSFENGAGITRDFSSSGIYFETDKSFTPGQSIEFTIVLEHVAPGRPVSVKYKGEIVRVEESGQRIGVAVAIQSYSLREDF
jgi:hypothetical protein